MTYTLALAWNEDVLTGSPVDKDFVVKNHNMPISRIKMDIRTDATSDADISVVISARQTPDNNKAFFNLPAFTQTINVAKMNSVVDINFPHPVKLVRATAYSPTGKRLYLAFFDLTRDGIF